MTRRNLAILGLAWLLSAATSAQVRPESAVAEAMRHVYRLNDYRAFDWIAAGYKDGTLTLLGYVRSPQLKEQAAAAARKATGIEEVVNNIEVLPVIASDDDLRLRAYLAIYGRAALERYAPGGQLSDAALNDLQEAAARFGLDGTDVGRGPHPIHIIVNGARVLLIGQVNTTRDRQIAETLIRPLPGVLAVTNQLRVANQK